MKTESDTIVPFERTKDPFAGPIRRKTGTGLRLCEATRVIEYQIMHNANWRISDTPPPAIDVPGCGVDYNQTIYGINDPGSSNTFPWRKALSYLEGHLDDKLKHSRPPDDHLWHDRKPTDHIADVMMQGFTKSQVEEALGYEVDGYKTDVSSTEMRELVEGFDRISCDERGTKLNCTQEAIAWMTACHDIGKANCITKREGSSYMFSFKGHELESYRLMKEFGCHPGSALAICVREHKFLQRPIETIDVISVRNFLETRLLPDVTHIDIQAIPQRSDSHWSNTYTREMPISQVTDNGPAHFALDIAWRFYLLNLYDCGGFNEVGHFEGVERANEFMRCVMTIYTNEYDKVANGGFFKFSNKKWARNEFAYLLKDTLHKHPEEIVALMDKVSISRQCIYNWCQALSIPSAQNLMMVLNAMEPRVDKEIRNELMKWRGKAKICRKGK